jgi:hypothetical protein
MAVNGSVSNDKADRAQDLDDDDLEDVHKPAPTRVASTRKPGRRRLPIIAVALVAAIAIVVTVVLLTTGSPKKKAATTTPKVSPGFVTFTDQKAGFQLSYPNTWVNAHPTDPSVPLQVSFGPNAAFDSMRVRVEPMSSSVNTTNVADIKQFTNAVLSGTNITVLQQASYSDNGLLGYWYFYAVPPTAAQPELVHSHFFIFPAHEMIEVVFQTTVADFTPLAHTFDQVSSSFRPLPATP